MGWAHRRIIIERFATRNAAILDADNAGLSRKEIAAKLGFTYRKVSHVITQAHQLDDWTHGVEAAEAVAEKRRQKRGPPC